jgi:hypothetical protein
MEGRKAGTSLQTAAFGFRFRARSAAIWPARTQSPAGTHPPRDRFAPIQSTGGEPMAKYRKGEWVEWNWGAGTGTGKVSDTFTEKVTRTIEGSEITRNADADNPAYMIEQEDGSRVLKSESELSKPD